MKEAARPGRLFLSTRRGANDEARKLLSLAPVRFRHGFLAAYLHTMAVTEDMLPDPMHRIRFVRKVTFKR